MREPYPIDITREQFEYIREDLEGAKKKTCPREVDLYEVFCAVLYLLKNAITWRAMPHDFPKWQLVSYYFRVWSAPDDKGLSLLDRVLADLEDRQRYALGRAETPSMVIVYSKSIQNADTAEEKGCFCQHKSTANIKIFLQHLNNQIM